jgi:hypothetical protein
MVGQRCHTVPPLSVQMRTRRRGERERERAREREVPKAETRAGCERVASQFSFVLEISSWFRWRSLPSPSLLPRSPFSTDLGVCVLGGGSAIGVVREAKYLLCLDVPPLLLRWCVPPPCCPRYQTARQPKTGLCHFYTSLRR